MGLVRLAERAPLSDPPGDGGLSMRAFSFDVVSSLSLSNSEHELASLRRLLLDLLFELVGDDAEVASVRAALAQPEALVFTASEMETDAPGPRRVHALP